MGVPGMNPSIEVSPNLALVDDVLHISVTGLSPAHHVTIVCRVQEDDIRLFSYAHYVSDASGCVDFHKMAASPGGSYDGVEPMGLIWSQKQEPGQKPGRRLTKSDVTTPLLTRFYVIQDHVTPDEGLEMINNEKQFLCSASCERWYMAEGVERLKVESDRLLGTLFIPKGSGPFPGVLDLFGTIGGIVEHRSALFASRGIASLALCYFTPGVGDGLVEDIEYFEEAIDYLLAHPKVQKPRAGIIGVSKGAELALLVASLCHKIKACVEINGLHFISLTGHRYKGKDYPMLDFDMDKTECMNGGTAFAPGYAAVPEEQQEKHAIHVEDGECEYLLIHGTDDVSMCPRAGEYVSKRLKKFGKTNYRLLEYPNAGHLIEPPHSPHFYSTYHGMFKGIVLWGGETRQHARAQEHAWNTVLKFWRLHLVDQSDIIAEGTKKSHL